MSIDQNTAQGCARANLSHIKEQLDQIANDPEMALRVATRLLEEKSRKLMKSLGESNE